ncbi:cytosine permease [Streptomyces incarnatus]|uniref:cytosine permease n=1 Tax=Streptomyces incarnatus TaxID=665007 RepID=UPI003CC5280D
MIHRGMDTVRRFEDWATPFLSRYGKNRTGGRSWYAGGWNWRAVVAFLAGGVLAVGGAGFKPLIDGRPIPALSSLADYGWAVGLGTSLVLYLALTLLTGRKEATP